MKKIKVNIVRGGGALKTLVLAVSALLLLVATINVFFSFSSTNTAFADNIIQKDNSWYDSNQKPFSVFGGFYDSDQVPNDEVSEYNDGTLSVTSKVVGNINAKTGDVRFIDQIVLTNLTSDKEITFNSVSAKLNSGFEGTDIKNWLIENFECRLFIGTAGSKYVPDFSLDSNESKTFNVITGLTGLSAGALANKVPFNFVYDYEVKDKTKYFYKVCVYGINEDTYDENPEHLNSLTFGPAIGETKDCLEHDGHHEHCIHNDTWETIIDNCKAGHADWYSDCLNDGCTKTVPINMNTILGRAPTDITECSNLNTYINLDYRHWNKKTSTSNCESANYATSRIRATLNGKNGGESAYAGSDCLDSTNCLLSCFPKVLQDNIKPKYMEVATSWEYGQFKDGKILTSTSIADKLWLLNAVEIYGSSSGQSKNKDYGKQYSKTLNMGITDFTYKNNIAFDEQSSLAGHGYRWLRNPSRGECYFACDVTESGNLGTKHTAGNWGLSPCFCL